MNINDQVRSLQGIAHDLFSGITGRNETSTGDAGEGSLDAQITHLSTGTSGSLACYRDDSGDGAPVLLLHSVNAAASAYEMKPLFEHYRGKRPVFALDLPGFGASSREAAAYTPERYAAAIERVLIDIVGAERKPATVIALSLSSEFAARAALLSPDLVRSLVYISPTGLGKHVAEGGPGPLSAVRKTLFNNDTLFKPLFRAIASRPSVRYFLTKSFEGAPPADLVEHAVRAAHAPGAWHAPAAFLSGSLFTANALRELYAKVNAPQLVIHGKDPYTDFGAVATLLATRTSGVELAVMPTNGMPHWEHTKRVLEAIDSFEASHPAKDQASS